MKKTISTSFALVVIIIISGFLGFLVWSTSQWSRTELISSPFIDQEKSSEINQSEKLENTASREPICSILSSSLADSIEPYQRNIRITRTTPDEKEIISKNYYYGRELSVFIDRTIPVQLVFPTTYDLLWGNEENGYYGLCLREYCSANSMIISWTTEPRNPQENHSLSANITDSKGITRFLTLYWEENNTDMEKVAATFIQWCESSEKNL